MQPAYSSNDAQQLRDSACRLVAQLGLAGFDNASIVRADAWVDSAEFQSKWSQGRIESAYDLGAFLGEAIIRRHGGTWSFSERIPCVVIDRNGHHLIDPFGKVQKRVLNGQADQLLALVNLVDHVVNRPALDSRAVQVDALSALEATSDEGPGLSGLRAIGYLCLALIGFPLALLIALLFVTDPSYALIGGACGVPVGLAAFVLFLRARRPAAPRFAPMTLAWEAQLTLDPLRQALFGKLDALGPQPAQAALEEVAFYTGQLRKVQAIVTRRDMSPGRGYIGYDTYGVRCSWDR